MRAAAAGGNPLGAARPPTTESTASTAADSSLTYCDRQTAKVRQGGGGATRGAGSNLESYAVDAPLRGSAAWLYEA